MNQNGGIHKGGFAVLCHRNGGSESPGILIMDIPGAEASGIKGDHLILNAGDIPLVFGDELRLEFPVAVSGAVNLELSILVFQVFLGLAVLFVRGKEIPFLIFSITEGGFEFRFLRLLEDILKLSLRRE